MRPETRRYLDTAERFLLKAQAILSVDLPDEVGRAAYYAAFHAAQALIYERTGQETKTHRGVRSQFLLFTKDDVLVADPVRRFLGDAYELKSIADYGIDPSLTVSTEEAKEALAAAQQFVACISGLLTD